MRVRREPHVLNSAMNRNRQRAPIDWRPLHAVLFTGLLISVTAVPAFCTWPLLWIIPLVAYGVLVALLPPFRQMFRWWGFGKATSSAVTATLAIMTGSCAVLISFDILTRPDVRAYRHFLPVEKLGGVWAAGVIFAVFNATFEEVVYRGILFDAIRSQLSDRTAIIATAFLFGYAHMQGYPPGPLGAVFAGIYGLCMGWLRSFSGGIGLPIAAHITADATIFILITRTGVFLD